MKVLQIADVKKLIDTIGYADLYKQLIATLEEDYSKWETFDKFPRVGNHMPDGVIELMPICGDEFHTYKYVNCHPKNPESNVMTVMGTGQLADVKTGKPLMFTEMTLLTALRTAANSAMAAKHLAKKDSKVLALIGTGAQSEFQFLAFREIFDLEEVRFYDTDAKAMDKFAENMKDFDIKISPCKDSREAVQGADIITTCTADKCYQTVLTKDMITSDVYINAIGGDCPGKTELEKELVESVTVVCEYLEQCQIEGEIQQLDEEFTCPEIYEIIRGEKQVNVETHGTVLFDSVGFAIEDHATLRLIYKLANELDLGTDMTLVPQLDNVKNLYSLL